MTKPTPTPTMPAATTPAAKKPAASAKTAAKPAAAPAAKPAAKRVAEPAAKPAATPAVKAAPKPVVKAAEKPANPPAPKAKAKPAPAKKVADTAEPAATAGKPDKKPNKPRPLLVRDSFTMPEDDFALIAKLKARALGSGRAAKKSELLRAGLRMLASMEATPLVQALDRLEAVKTGRPKKSR